MLKFLIICPLVFLAGFVDAIAGGGGLISLPAYMLAGLPVHNAIATNKMSSCMGTSLSTAKLTKQGYIKWKQVIFCVISAFIGSACGAKLALMVSDYYFKIILLIILPITAGYVLFGKGLKKEQEPYSLKKTIISSMIIALFIGMYDGFYGPGTGTFLILLLTGVSHISLKEANGTAKAINLTTNIASLVVYLINGKVIILLGLTAGLFNIAGNYLGIKLFTNKGSKIVKPIMICVITIFFVKVLLELI